MDVSKPNLNTLAYYVYSISASKGFWDDANFGEKLMLVVTEAAEAMEHFRDGKTPGKLEWELNWRGVNGPCPIEFYNGEAPVGVPAGERGTYFRHLDADKCGADGWVRLDLSEAAQRQMFAELGFDIKPDGIPAEFADIIIRVLDICGAYDVDIESAVRQKVDYNANRPHMHGRKR